MSGTQIQGFENLTFSKSLVNISSNGSRFLQSINASISSSPNIIAGSDNGNWFGGYQSAGVVAQIGGFEYGSNLYGHGKFMEQILYGTEKNLTDTQFINHHRKAFNSI